MKTKKFYYLIFLLYLLPIFCFGQAASKPEFGAPAHEYLYWFYKILIGVGVTAVVLGLVLAGLSFITSAGDPGRLSDARDQAIKSFLGLLILVFTGTILYITLGLKIEDIFKSPSEIAELITKKEELKKTPGVYAMTVDGTEHYLHGSYSELPEGLNKEIVSIRIVGPFKVVMFTETGFKGSCLEWLTEGRHYALFPSSIIIYSEKSSSGAGNNITFYRKAFYNHNGKEKGEYNIGGPTGWKSLENILFKNVPEDEKKCIEWKDNGSCKIRESPTLKETTSIKIEGNLSILLAGREKKGGTRGYCQFFYDKGGTYSVANLKNEYIRAKNRFPYLMQILPGSP